MTAVAGSDAIFASRGVLGVNLNTRSVDYGSGRSKDSRL